MHNYLFGQQSVDGLIMLHDELMCFLYECLTKCLTVNHLVFFFRSEYIKIGYLYYYNQQYFKNDDTVSSKNYYPHSFEGSLFNSFCTNLVLMQCTLSMPCTKNTIVYVVLLFTCTLAYLFSIYKTTLYNKGLGNFIFLY